MKKKVLVLLLALCVFSLDARPRKRKQGSRAITTTKVPRYSLLKQETKKESDSAPATKVNKLLFLKESLDNLAKTADKKTALGIKVTSLKHNATIYQKNPDQVLIPASTTKVFTGAAALKILGPEATFETQLYTDKQLGPHKIHHLYIKGGGDPTLATKDLESLVHQIKTPISEIKGDIIVDASIFDQQNIGPGWNKKDGLIYDKAPVMGLMVNHSCIRVRVTPSRGGGRPRVTIDPDSSFARIENKARTVLQAKKNALHVFYRTDGTVVVTGKIARNSKQKHYRIAIDRPDMYAGHVLLSLLKKHKIICKTRISKGMVSSDAKLLARHTSEPVSEIVRLMMKPSDNLYADALFKKIGAVAYGAPGTWAKGKKAVEHFLVNVVKMPIDTLALNDGSGLSHTNRISPTHLSTFLTWIYKESPFRDYFIDSLPISGVDGTLRKRMRNRIAQSKIKAKTGNLPGITGLAGYITPPQGEPLVFVIMINRGNKSAVAYKRKFEDKICTLLAAHAFSTF